MSFLDTFWVEPPAPREPRVIILGDKGWYWASPEEGFDPRLRGPFDSKEEAAQEALTVDLCEVSD